eukprot:scaffold11471_cov244-Amphora_coffeaeformis.AAC.1
MGNYEYTHSINTPQISERKERSSMDDALTTLFGNVSDSPGREGIPKKKQCAIDMPRRLFFSDIVSRKFLPGQYHTKILRLISIFPVHRFPRSSVFHPKDLSKNSSLGIGVR